VRESTPSGSSAVMPKLPDAHRLRKPGQILHDRGFRQRCPAIASNHARWRMPAIIACKPPSGAELRPARARMRSWTKASLAIAGGLSTNG